MQSNEYILEMKRISKRYYALWQLDDVSFSLKKGEVHALVGDIGAGKSALAKIIAGLRAPDDGEILIDGKTVEWSGPEDAQAVGIEAIFPHIAHFPGLNVMEALFKGRGKAKTPFSRANRMALHQEAATLLARLAANFDTRAMVAELSDGQRQVVEIAKVLSANTRIIVLGQPSPPLQKREREVVYRAVENMREEGVSVVYVTHCLEEVYRIADRVTVLRFGSSIGCWNVADVDDAVLVPAITGYGSG